MSKKLWISETKFVEVAEDRDAMLMEIAPRSRSIDWFGLYAFLPDPDPVLQRLGQDMTVYRQLLADAHVGACWINRKSATLSREWEIREPADNLKRTNKQVMEAIDRTMMGLDVYQIITDSLEAPFFGMSPLEVIWEAEAAWAVKDVIGRPPEWFAYNEENELRFKSRENMVAGEPIPDKKFVVARHHASYLNPYGDRVLSRCFWPVVFKKGGFKYWAVFTEKYGMPWVVGKVPKSTNDTERTALLSRLASMVQDAVAVISDDESVELKESAFKASSAGIYEKLIEAANKECSKAIIGHTAGTESTPGKLGAEDTQIEVRADLAAQDQRMITGCFNELFQWIIELNFGPTVAVPEFAFIEDEDLQGERAGRDDKLKQQGVRFAKIYYQRRYNLEEDEFEVTDPASSRPGVATPGQADPASFAETDPMVSLAVDGQKRLDALADREIEASGKPAFAAYSDVMTDWLGTMPSLDRAGERIFGLYESLPADMLSVPLARALMDADGIGVSSAGGEPEFADPPSPVGFGAAGAKWGTNTPFREAIDYFRARAFTVSGIAKADLLSEIKAEIERQLDEGWNLRRFRDEFSTIMARHGFDPLHPFRIDTIFRTNMQGVFQAGRYRQMTDPAVLTARPFWRYVAVMDGSTRPAHAAMHGKIFPADHDFWRVWYPPNGYN
uniref:Phage head morphogenesis domain-containing protein n=1 Tax=viral metagenome TaxID=1070528 RepID=A0A6M3KQJ0_9ZZZZ